VFRIVILRRNDSEAFAAKHIHWIVISLRIIRSQHVRVYFRLNGIACWAKDMGVLGGGDWHYEPTFSLVSDQTNSSTGKCFLHAMQKVCE
jgi:hypothetical protein